MILRGTRARSRMAHVVADPAAWHAHLVATHGDPGRPGRARVRTSVRAWDEIDAGTARLTTFVVPRGELPES